MSNMEFIFLPVLLLTSLVALVAGGTIYLLQAFGLYRMAKNLGLPSPWMAFVPIASSYLMGLIAEKDSMGRRTLKYSWILLITQIALTFFSGAVYIVLWLFRISGFAGILIIFYLIHGVINITSAVFYYIALYRVYKLYDPDDAPLFIILSIFFSISVPILLFILRNRQPIMYYGNPFEQTDFQ